MSFLKGLYNTKELSAIGGFILIALGILFVLGFFIPNYQPLNSSKQIYTISGLNTKYNDETEVAQFFESIKENNGYLVLGTSETTGLPDGNYYDFLNSDEDLQETGFSVLAGAGRTCGNLIPVLLENKEEAEGLNLIYFINPVYWRKDLCEVNLDYGQRYLNYFMTTIPNLSAEEEEKYYSPIRDYQEKLNPLIKASESIEYFIRSLFRNYNFDLKYELLGNDLDEKLTFIDGRAFLDFTEEDYENRLATIDTAFNIHQSFSHKNWFKPINEKVTHRTEELEAFIAVCKDLGINATFILGPTNERFIQAYSSSSLKGYEDISEQIESMLIKEEVSYIDVRELNGELGAFSDHQHHSSYGAYLLYELIKKKIYEEE
ncbi:MAG: D-alanyl-lipoteichoic acid biosynthesis protein DltD [Bacteroidota bacterium]